MRKTTLHHGFNLVEEPCMMVWKKLYLSVAFYVTMVLVKCFNNCVQYLSHGQDRFFHAKQMMLAKIDFAAVYWSSLNQASRGQYLLYMIFNSDILGCKLVFAEGF